ncbi:MAG: phosphoribosylpyrophosphate synthetase [Sphingobacteriaceae bacterium]
MEDYETLLDALNGLKAKGYTHDFNLSHDLIEVKSKGLALKPEEFEIDEFHRFEGESDPGDNSIVYGISSAKHDIKGVLVNAYGTYADSLSSGMLKKLSVR